MLATPRTIAKLQKTRVDKYGFAPTASVAAGAQVLRRAQKPGSVCHTSGAAGRYQARHRAHEQICVAKPNKTANAKTAPSVVEKPHAVNASRLPAKPLASTVIGVDKSAA